MSVVRDPRPTAARHPDEVPICLLTNSSLPEFKRALAQATNCAVDTETVYVEGGIGELRVVSAATRDADGTEQAWVVDVACVDKLDLAECLSGLECSAWNADFDAGVIDRGLLEPARRAGRPVKDMIWWDAQIADALLYQGISGFSFYHGLAWAAETYLGLRVDGKGTTQLSYRANEVLSAEQISYAAADAVETLWVSDQIKPRIEAAGLDHVCALEMSARPFLDHMQRVGLPFDWSGWADQIEIMKHRKNEVVSHLAALTGGGQASLFSEYLKPSWNPASERQTKEILNRYASERVLAWTRSMLGEQRLLIATDPLRADTLAEIGGELSETLLEFRDLAKMLSTYGDSIRDHLDDDGRVRPEYLQVVGTNTGRLASRNPNAQNLSPRMKPYFRPADPGRVFVCADLSQAELRFVAQVSGDKTLRQAFIDGLDVHISTAEAMFEVDMARLASKDPDRHSELRAKAKRINFGIVYGQRGAGLARSLSQAGVDTSPDEGRDLLDAYLDVYVGVADWCDGRDRFIEKLRSDPGKMDWAATLRLHSMWRGVRAVRRSFRDQHRRWPTAEEVQADPTLDLSLEEVAWALSFHAPVALGESGEPFGFASHTPAGRRQQFTMHTEGILATAASTIARSPKPGPASIRSSIERDFRVDFWPGGISLSAAEITKILENRELRRSVIDRIPDTMGLEAQTRLLDGALRERISQMANAYRNAPIQGGVADVMLDAYGALHEALSQWPRVHAVQTVHDSVVVECDETQADEVAKVVKITLEQSMERWCPDIPAVADTDIRRSLSDADVIYSLDSM